MAVDTATPVVQAGRTMSGPRGKPIVGSALDFRNDTVGTLMSGWRTYGDAVKFQGPGSFFPVHFFAHPDQVKYVLQDNYANYPARSPVVVEKFRQVVGDGLVTTQGDVWAAQRRLAQLAFQRDRLNALAGLMVSATDEMLDEWQEHAEHGRPVDVQSEMMHLILNILASALFSADMRRDAAKIELAVATQAKWLNDEVVSGVTVPLSVPIPRHRRFLEQRRSLDEVVEPLIAERRRSGEDKGDFLSMLLDAEDEETGEKMSDQMVKDQVKTFLIAGHETTATTLGWTFYLLAKYPEADRRGHEEVDQLLGGRKPGPDDGKQLTYMAMVLDESLRLYPPLWTVARSPIHDDEVDGYRVPAGGTIILSPYITHRHPDFWDNPEGFDPERFTPERSEGRPRFAYFPFSGGPRGCIGFPFAMLELHLVLPRILQRFRLSLVPGYPVEPEAAISLRQKHGALMTLEPV
jgi:cytochrome P450